MQTIVIMPFDGQFDDVYEAIKESIDRCKVTVSGDSTHPRRDAVADLKAYRVDEGHGAANIMMELLEQIQLSHLCIADISGNSPNVLWELGYVMGLKKPTIILTQSLDALPFDAKAYRCRQYDRGRLNETLVEALATEIAAVLRDVPEQFVVPEDFGHAQTLAMSIAAPVYFLDADWRIRYMNEAARLVFNAKKESPRDWVGESLVDFINSFDTQLVNLAEIQKNLHVQKEWLARAGDPKTAPPLNIEPIILDSGPYGVVDLRKIGVAVRNPNDSSITGWVVSFNLVNARDPTKYSEFLKEHQGILKHSLFGQPDRPGAAAAAPQVTPQVKWSGWREDNVTNVTFEWAEDYKSKDACCSYMLYVMINDQDRYGLDSAHSLPVWFFDYKQTEFIEIKRDGEILGVLRLHMDHDLDQYIKKFNNLNDNVKNLWEHRRGFVDVGAYFHKLAPSEIRRKWLAKLLAKAVHRCEDRGCVNLYAQVARNLLGTYEDYGFERAGGEFECQDEGWGTRKWIPIYVPNWNFRADVEAGGSDAGRQFREEFEREKAL